MHLDATELLNIPRSDFLKAVGGLLSEDEAADVLFVRSEIVTGEGCKVVSVRNLHNTAIACWTGSVDSELVSDGDGVHKSRCLKLT